MQGLWSGKIEGRNGGAEHVPDPPKGIGRRSLDEVWRSWPWLAAAALATTLGVAGWPQQWWQPRSPFTNPSALADLLVVVQVAALLFWWRPLACFVLAEGAMLAYGVLDYPSTPADYAALIATAVGAWGASRALSRYGVFVVALGSMLAIGLYRTGGEPWAEAVADAILVTFAWLAGRGVHAEQVALSARRRLAAEAAARQVAEERMAMAGALHDRVGNALALATRELEAAQMLGPGQAERLVSGAWQQLRGTLGEVSKLVSGWARDGMARDGQLADSAGAVPVPHLVRGLGWWLAVLSGVGVNVSVTTIGDLSALDALTEGVLAAVANEALANIARHSAATSAEVALEVSPKWVSVSVRDPGPARPGHGSGAGLERIRERVERSGGSLSAGPENVSGFRLVAQLPVRVPQVQEAST